VATTYKHLTLDDRIEIEKGVDAGHSDRTIAARIGRSHTTVWRERMRGSWRPSNTSEAYTPYRDPFLRAGPTTGKQYRAGQAHQQAAARSRRSHRPWKFASDELIAHVVDKLRDGWTPEMIAGRRRIEFPRDPARWMCPETIYVWIYRDDNRHRGLTQYLTRGHKKRRKRKGRRVHSSRIDRRRPISERSDAANDRSEFGHWEGDTVLGRRGRSHLHTEVERKSRLLAARKVKATTAADGVRAQMAIFGNLPPGARRSVTMDNGSEFHHHFKVADALGMDTFFADPYSSWQRGTNEHHNGRLRRFFPKGTDFDQVGARELNAVVKEINNQPRKVLGWRTPAEVYAENLRWEKATTRCTSE
jgi:IS30 family transposase